MKAPDPPSPLETDQHVGSYSYIATYACDFAGLYL